LPSQAVADDAVGALHTRRQGLGKLVCDGFLSILRPLNSKV